MLGSSLFLTQLEIIPQIGAIRVITTAEMFRSLRESTDAGEYRRAAYEEAPIEVWFDIIERMPDMRFWVAQNKTVPVTVLELLANDPDSNVRDMVAKKRKLPESLQFQLAEDSDACVRTSLACNKSTTLQVLKILLRDTDAIVRDAACRSSVRAGNGPLSSQD